MARRIALVRFGKRAALVASTAAFLFGTLGVGSAAADQYSNSWSSNDRTGYCGDTSGGYVLAVQQFERSLGSNDDALDDYFGSHTYAGLKKLQAHYGITQDGCAGPVTWDHMRESVHPIVPPDYACPSLKYCSYVYLGHTEQYFNHLQDCAWASYTAGNPVAAPVRQGEDYSFSSSLHGQQCET